MQGGFLCLETGLTRSKNNINVAMKNLADLGMSIVLYWAVGYGLMWGASNGGWIGSSDFIPDVGREGAWFAVFLLFGAMFCGTTVTIYECLAIELGVEYEYTVDLPAGAAVEGDPADWLGMDIPKALYDDLLTAAQGQAVTDLRQHMTRLEALGDEGRSLAAHLRGLAMEYDMEAIKDALEELR